MSRRVLVVGGLVVVVGRGIDGEPDVAPTAPHLSASPPEFVAATTSREVLNESDRHRRLDLFAAPDVAGDPRPAMGVTEQVDLVGAEPERRRRRFFGRRDPGRPGGDRKIQVQLARLSRRDARWRVLHGIPVGVNGAPIDHLVIGPGGVFALSAKFHPDGRVWVRGNVFQVDDAAYAYMSNSRHEALRASRCLRAACGFAVSVAGVVVVIGAEDIVVSDAPGDVHVVDRAALRGWLAGRNEVLDSPTIAAVHDAARRAGTWDWMA